MQVFKITGKFEQNRKWSSREADFIGYFVKRDGDDVIEGYVEEQTGTPYDPVRYITGLYINANQLVFMKMSKDSFLKPLCYLFPNISEQGFWSDFKIHGGFFYDRFFMAHGFCNGHATVRLQEIVSETEKMELAREISAVYAEKNFKAVPLNRDLMEDVKILADFLDEYSQ